MISAIPLRSGDSAARIVFFPFFPFFGGGVGVITLKNE